MVDAALQPSLACTYCEGAPCAINMVAVALLRECALKMSVGTPSFSIIPLALFASLSAHILIKRGQGNLDAEKYIAG